MATQTQLDAIDAAIATGMTEVRIGDKVVKYQTTADLLNAREVIARQLRGGGSLRYKLADFSD